MTKSRKKRRTVKAVLEDVRRLAVEYYEMTNRPLGVTGELAEAAAADKLKLELASAREAGYDATKRQGRRTLKFQIKGRRAAPNKKHQRRVPKINLDQPFDYAVLVIFDEWYKPLEMRQASRAKIKKKLDEPGSKARNERRTLNITQFISIADKVWPCKRRRL